MNITPYAESHDDNWNDKDFITKRLLEQAQYRDGLLIKYYDNEISEHEYMFFYEGQAWVTKRLQKRWLELEQPIQ